jgi:hypothetical protein
MAAENAQRLGLLQPSGAFFSATLIRRLQNERRSLREEITLTAAHGELTSAHESFTRFP